ncbi:ADP-ribosyl cyclase/cyclic ADP-ribose hydrolase 1 [Maylandia zebra]|uniref:ADP-ribosyl cyclase/cyclic ADP-ribose hydrolase n=2 Tax=Haplochromini TaxID=319058 RepID=A0A3P9CTC1_9CICH|nr:ADP-ribosyl cyclase/cyclic ADP-ribose hydrolase 1 [Maylandia zebra]XP_026035874.1 ADP-ribosyl cyclase/cyclic ADP-ribose hydrolase 1-like [Astatotilapia calliptera]
MEHEQSRRLGKRRRKRCVILIVIVVLIVIVIIAVVLGLTLRQNKSEFKSTFLSRCEKFNQTDCQKVWDAFEQAYVNKDPCKVAVEAYDPLIVAAPFKPQCNRMMFWSKTKDVVHGFTEKRDCFVTLEDTLLGSVLDGLTWCGKEGSKGTFTTGCPGWSECENNPVRSFWRRISAAFADVACGDVTAMLSGSIDTPFNPTSIFASIEVVRFQASRIKSLNVVMVLQQNAKSNCTDPSLKNLRQTLDTGITYSCKDVPESRIQECGAKPEIACGACW